MNAYSSAQARLKEHPDLPQVEVRIGKLLSPYALTKVANELYADVFCWVTTRRFQ